MTGISTPSTQGLGFTYNANDDITAITDSVGGNAQTLGYDTLNRLTSASGSYGTQSYTYDADGNRTLTTINSVNTTYTPDLADNRLASLSGGSAVTYSYDANGNTTADATHTYQFDDTNRLTTVDSGTTATYIYNTLGQRTGKTTSSGTSLFVYDENGRLLGEYDGSGNPVQEHIWLGARPIAVATTTGLYFIHSDELMTPRVVTNSSHSVIWNWVGDSFGNGSPTGSFTYNQRFPGQYFDSETGHSYNYFRDYDSATDRYQESDPSGINGGANTYLYAGANPDYFFDIYGLSPLSMGDVVNYIQKNNLSKESPELILCIVYKESTFDPNAKQKPPNTAQGLMGVTDPTATYVGYDPSDMSDPAKNIQAGTKMLNRFVNWKGFGNGNLDYGLTHYGTGSEYAKQIQECEKCVKKENACPTGDALHKCLEPLHKH